MSRFAFRDVRTRLLVIVVVTLAVALTAATAAFALLLHDTSSHNANDVLRQRVDTELALLQVRNGQLTLGGHSKAHVADSRVWIFAGGRTLEQPISRPATAAAARELAASGARYRTVDDERLFSSPILMRGRRYGTIVAGVSLAPYERTAHVALVGLIVFATALLLIAASSVWWLLRSALRPVARMTEQASTWVATDLDGRFRLGEPHDELTRLAWTLDELLDRIAASLRHERLLSAELSHELRTPLAKLRAEAELALRRPRSQEDYADALRGVIANADRIDRIIAVLLAAADGTTQQGVADAATVARMAVTACAPVAAETGVSVEIDDAPPLRIGVDAAFAERILNPVLDNACRYASSRVRVSLSRTNGSVSIVVADDGPGLAEEELEQIFEPATRGEAGRRAGTGAGLGLALARRLARTVTGDVVASAAHSGAAFVVLLPAA